jgi:hypothetical protein
MFLQQVMSLGYFLLLCQWIPASAGMTVLFSLFVFSVKSVAKMIFFASLHDPVSTGSGAGIPVDGRGSRAGAGCSW